MRYIVLVLLILCLAACGNTASPAVSPTATPTATPTPTPTPTITADASDEDAPVDVVDDAVEVETATIEAEQPEVAVDETQQNQENQIQVTEVAETTEVAEIAIEEPVIEAVELPEPTIEAVELSEPVPVEEILVEEPTVAEVAEPVILLTVTGYDGDIIAPTEVAYTEGCTAFSVLRDMTKAMGIVCDSYNMGDIAYVRGIGDVWERDKGPLSGWEYFVNGERPSVGAGQCILQPGDKVQWMFSEKPTR